MPDFAQNAIGLYARFKDEISPGLPKLQSNYTAFVKKIEAQNQRLYKNVSSTMASVSDSVASLEELPKRVKSALSQAINLPDLSKFAEKISETIESKSMKTFVKNVAEATVKSTVSVLGKANIRLSAMFPKRRLSSFAAGPLRALYSGMPQPPDYKGKLSIPKFATGGQVGGTKVGGPGGVDKVLSLLTRGEYVLPVKTVDRLEKVAASLGGSFKNLVGSLQKPVAFIALSTALTSLQGAFGKTAHSAREFVTQAHIPGKLIEDTGNFYQTLNAANKSMQLSRGDLRAFKQSLLNAGDAAGILPDELGNMVDVTQSLHISNRDTVKDVAVLGAQLHKAGQISEQTAGEFVYLAGPSGIMGLANDQVKALAGSAISLNHAVSGGLGTDQLLSAVPNLLKADHAFSMYFGTLQNGTKESVTKNIMALGQAVESSFSGGGSQFMELVARGLTGDVDALTALGTNAQELQKTLAGPDGATTLLTGLQDRLSGLSDLSAQGSILKNLTGVPDVNIAKLGAAKDAAVGLQKALITDADATIFLNDATQKQLTIFDRATIFVNRAAGGLESFGIPARETLDFVRELGPAGTASLVYLSTFAIDAVKAGFSLTKNLIPSMLRMVGIQKAVAVATAATDVAGAAGAVGGAGLGASLGGIAAGLAAFANPATLIGLTAVTVGISAFALAIGTALRIAGPGGTKFIADSIGYIANAIASVALGAINAVAGVIHDFLAIPPDKMIQAGLGFLAFGAGFAAFVGSIALAAVAGPAFLLVGIPMLIATGLAMKLVPFGMIADSIGVAAGAFNGLDAGALAGGIAKAGLALAFVAAIAVASAGLLAATVVTGASALVTGALDWIGSWFSSGGTGSIIADNAVAMVATVNTVAAAFSNVKVDTGTIKAASAKLFPIVGFIGKVALLNAEIAASGVATAIGKGANFLAGLLTLDFRDSYTKLADSAPQIAKAIKSFVTAFQGMDAKSLESVKTTFGVVAEFLSSAAWLSLKLDAMGLADAFFDKATKVFNFITGSGWTSAVQGLGDNAENYAYVLGQFQGAFSTYNPETIARVGTQMTGVLGIIGSIFKGTQDATNAASALGDTSALSPENTDKWASNLTSIIDSMRLVWGHVTNADLAAANRFSQAMNATATGVNSMAVATGTVVQGSLTGILEGALSAGDLAARTTANEQARLEVSDSGTHDRLDALYQLLNGLVSSSPTTGGAVRNPVGQNPALRGLIGGDSGGGDY